jgi:Family of unknown function (DUF6527)
MKLLRWIEAAARSIAGSTGRVLAALVSRPRKYSIRRVDELPDKLKPSVLYVVTEGSLPMHASMACPHGRCWETLNMNLLADDDPVWTLTVEPNGSPSLHPSVWRKSACGCHFWMREGRLQWC